MAGLSCLGQELYVDVSRDVKQPRRIVESELRKLPEGVSADGKYRGVWLDEVLAKAGAEFGKATIHSYVVAERSDGYEAVYGMSEIDPSMSGSRVLLAIDREGKQRRLVAPHDKRAARGVRRLAKLEVVALMR